MGKRTRSQRRAEKRARVDRAERVRPSPEALRHKRPWSLQVLLALGREGGGIDDDDFEAALQIVETFKALGADRAMRPSALDFTIAGGSLSMSDREARRCVQWSLWANRLPRGLPWRLVAWIEDDEPIVSVEVLRRACRLWDKIGSEMRTAVDKTRRAVLTIPPLGSSAANVVARPVNLPVQTISTLAAVSHQLTGANALCAQIRELSDAPATAPAQTTRRGR